MIYQNGLFAVVIVVLQLQLSTTQGWFIPHTCCKCYFILCFLGNSLTFSPSTPLCIGETVQMVCYVVPPTAQPFIDPAALISLDDSSPASINIINTNALVGVDTTRYTADVTGLGITTDRPGIRLTITNYQASDGATNFSCHGAYSGGVPSPVLISAFPQSLAGMFMCFLYICLFTLPSRLSFLSSRNSLSDRHQLF